MQKNKFIAVISILAFLISFIKTANPAFAQLQTFPSQNNNVIPNNPDSNIKSKYQVKIPSNKPDIIQTKNEPVKKTFEEFTTSVKASSNTSNTQPQAQDTTPPTAVGAITGSATLFQLNASWAPAKDPESGITSYAFAIGTKSTGNFDTLPDVRYWQDNGKYTNISVSLKLDPAKKYYVSVYAYNGKYNNGPIKTSGPITPVHVPVGKDTYTMKIDFSGDGIDLDGNPTTGWSQEQKDKMSSFANKMYPVIVDLYGPPADDYTVKIVRDLRYTGSNVFFSSLDEIHMSDAFYPQLFTHELLHAMRNDHTLSSNSMWEFDGVLSSFEESFAQGVSYMAMNEYIKRYPNDDIVANNSVYGSGFGWNYDFENSNELRTRDFWSDNAGTGIYWERYEMGAAAINKIELEHPGFAKEFNKEFYRRINADPKNVYSTKPLIIDIIRTIVPTVEGLPTETWIKKQNIFYAEVVPGNKIWHSIQDYLWHKMFVFHSMYFVETMWCGNEWACYDDNQQKYIYHRLNGSTGTGKLSNANGDTVWSGPLQILPTSNPSDGTFQFGAAVKNLTNSSTLEPWPGGNPDQYIMNLNPLSLYKFESTFTDAKTNNTTSNNFYRVMGDPISAKYNGIWGGIIGHKNGTIYFDHEQFPEDPGIPVTNGAFYGNVAWAGIANPSTGYADSVPGKVNIRFVDSDTNQTFTTQRNIDRGTIYGNQMFLLDFESFDAQPPTINIIAPVQNKNITANSFTITANASDNKQIDRVAFYVDGKLISADTSSNYSAFWDTSLEKIGNHVITAKAYDLAGNTTTSTVNVTISDTVLPSINLTNPANSIKVARNSNVTIKATASDNRALQKVEFYSNNNLKCADTTSPYSCVWNVPNTNGVQYVLKATAYDMAGNKKSDSVTVTSKN